MFTPGADGALAMAAARSRRAGDPLLVIDQFEEAFTLSGAAFARPWLGDVARYAQESAPVVVVVRGDHVAELGADEELARLAERGLHLVAPLAGDRLREAVEGPARVAGLRLEPGLVDLVVRDADGQPGALPLLSHALAETWRRREAGLLTVDGYRAVGGIQDAVAASAERLYDGLEPRRARRAALADAAPGLALGRRRTVPHAAARVRRGRARPRTPPPARPARPRSPRDVGDGGFDLAHEALVRAWPRLRGWLDEDRVGQQIRRHLAMAAAGWEALDRPEGELYRGARLAATLEWLERGHEPLTDTERDFIEASRAVADDQVRRLADDARRQRRQNRRLRVLVAVAAVLLVVAAAAGVVARDQGLAAERGRGLRKGRRRAARHESTRGSFVVSAPDRPCRGGDARGAGLAPGVRRARAVGLGGGARRRARLPRLSLHPSGRRRVRGPLHGGGRRPTTTGSWSPLAVQSMLVDPDTGEASAAFRRGGRLQRASFECAPGERGRDARRAAAHHRPASQAARPPAAPWSSTTWRRISSRRRTDRRPVPSHRCGHQPRRQSGDGDGRHGSGAGTSRRGMPRAGRSWPALERGASAVAFGVGDIAYLGTSGGPVREVAARTLNVRA